MSRETLSIYHNYRGFTIQLNYQKVLKKARKNGIGATGYVSNKAPKTLSANAQYTNEDHKVYKQLKNLNHKLDETNFMTRWLRKPKYWKKVHNRVVAFVDTVSYRAETEQIISPKQLEGLRRIFRTIVVRDAEEKGLIHYES